MNHLYASCGRGSYDRIHGLLRFKGKINTGSVQHFRQHYAFAEGTAQSTGEKLEK
jgi:hypothetical protein